MYRFFPVKYTLVAGMRAFLSSILLLLFCSAAFAQVSDFVTVKKRNNRTLTTYFPGSPITCETTFGYFINGYVEAVHSDSVFVKQYAVQMVPTMFGVNSIDTLGSYIVGIHYKEIDVVTIPKKESFGYVKNGSIFIIGGLGYALLNLVNGKYLKQSLTSSENIKSLGIALGVAGAGYLINRLHISNNRNGKKYRVEYVHMTDQKGLKGF